MPALHEQTSCSEDLQLSFSLYLLSYNELDMDILRTFWNSLKQYFLIKRTPIIFIYMCVCVCVCVCITNLSTQSLWHKVFNICLFFEKKKKKCTLGLMQVPQQNTFNSPKQFSVNKKLEKYWVVLVMVIYWKVYWKVWLGYS